MPDQSLKCDRPKVILHNGDPLIRTIYVANANIFLAKSKASVHFAARKPPCHQSTLPEMNMWTKTQGERKENTPST